MSEGVRPYKLTQIQVK